MLQRSSLRTLVFLWLAWAVVVIGFQSLVQARYQPNRPDRALEWTPNETARNSQNDKPYLLEPLMNNQVSWDSEFYLSIATAGYDDPDVRIVETPLGDFAMSYAFFPLYPLLMQIVRAPLLWFGLTPIGASAVAGVLVSLLGTLAGMIALYDLASSTMGEKGGLRAAFYLLIFPTSFFLAQVYTEGLFIGLAFGCLALLRRKHLLLAAILAGLATWTRSVGVFLVIPLAISWLNDFDWKHLSFPQIMRAVPRGLLVLVPVGAYLVWRALLGYPFDAVQEHWFGRGFFELDRLQFGFSRAVENLISGENLQMRIYFILEFASVLLATAACLVMLRRYPLVSLFGLIAIVISVTSGSPQSWIRYMLVIPSLYLALARWGDNVVFDRAWTIFSLLLMGMQVSLFTFDMWVA